MLNFLKYLFTPTKPVISDGTELILGNETDNGYVTPGKSTVLVDPTANEVYRETNFAYDARDRLIHDASKTVLPDADIVRDKPREKLTAAQRERKNKRARELRAAKRKNYSSQDVVESRA